jgi:hypothetical protein
MAMAEKEFVDQLLKTIRGFPCSVAVRPSDSFTLGMPDVFGWVRLAYRTLSIAIEAKQLRPLMDDPFHKGRRTGQMLKHAFTGPQISMLRSLEDAGVDAFGLVRVSVDTAFRIAPRDIPRKTGNFTHEELVEFSSVVERERGHWNIWNIRRADGQLSSSRHRDDPGDGDRGHVGPGEGGAE